MLNSNKFKIKFLSNNAFVVDLFFISLIIGKFINGVDIVGLVITGILGFLYLVMKRESIKNTELILFVFIISHSFISFFIYKEFGYIEPLIYTVIWGLVVFSLIYFCSIKDTRFFYIANEKFINYMIFIVIIGIIDWALYSKFGIKSFLRTYVVDSSTESFFRNPNPFGLSSAIAFCLCFSFSRSKFKLIILFFGVLISGSKMALVCVFMYIILEKATRKQILFIFLISLFLILALIYTDFDKVLLLLNKRYEIWTEAFYFFKMREYSFWTGLGSGTFQHNYSSNPLMGLHSFFVYLIVEMGFVSGIIFVLSLLYTFVKYKNSEYFAIIFIILIASITENLLLNEQIIQLSFILSLAGVLNRIKGSYIEK